MTFYRTTHPEEVVLELAGKYQRVLVRCDYNTPRPIRLRRKTLYNLPAWDARRAAGMNQINQWRDQGGVLLYHFQQWKNERLPRHDAQVLCEAPLDLATLYHYAEDTQGPVVIRVPLKWDSHREAVCDNRPDATLCKRMWALVKGGGTAAEAGIVGVEPGLAVADDTIKTELGLNTKQVTKLEKALFGTQRHRILRLYPRVFPTTDRALIPVYNAVLACPTYEGAHLVVDSVLRPASKYWSNAVGKLLRAGNLGARTTLTVYYPGPQPNWKHCDRERKSALENLDALIQRVESAPLWPRANGTQSPAPARSLSAGHPGGTPR
jgi:hypothetical protein